MKNKHKIASLVAGVIAVGSVVTPALALAQTASSSIVQSTPSANAHAKLFTKKEMASRAKSINGTVVSVSGSTITLADKKNTTYTIDTTNAKLTGEGIPNTLVLSDILINDKISVRGSVNGTNISAISISDKSLVERTVFSGKVTAISGTSITLTKNKKTYTVDANSAILTKGFGKNAKIVSLSNVAVGDRLTAVKNH